MKFKSAYLIIFSILCFAGKSQNSEWLATSSVISFKIKNAGFNTNGKFTGLKSKIIFDATTTSGNLIEASLDASTIDTDNSTRDGHLKKEEYFDVQKFPLIKLSSQKFLKQNEGSFNGYFKLNLKNVVKDIMIPFTFSEKEGKGVFKGSFTLNRLDYGVGGSSIIMSDNVTISLTVYVIKK
ncbi:YceI family protein [Aurantibacillus circumpalustris]|uniref:YceI family protein n=1 Tax=Aurantibacillus circumpalustris TaxID=3036359 RepID=UPI00295AD776|nr:YceI family protein [Aurantibacillus circumpalustris]